MRIDCAGFPPTIDSMRGTVQSPTQNVALLPSNKNRGNGPPMRRTASMCLSDNILEDTYKMLFAEDPGIAVEAICAFREMQFVPFDDLDDMRNEQDTEGLVQRRAPKNPLRSPLMGKFRKGKKDKKR